MKQLDYLVVGTGRCGTVYMARLLTSLGIPCGHESVFDYCGFKTAIARLEGTEPLRLSLVSQVKFHLDSEVPERLPEWLPDLESIRADSSFLASPHVRLKCLENTKFIHVVRNPIKVINSFVNHLDYFKEAKPSSENGLAWEEYIYAFTPDLYQETSQKMRAALYYVRWNQMIERRLKDLNHIRVRVEDGPGQVIHYTKTQTVNVFDERTANTQQKSREPFRLDDLPKGAVKDDLLAMMHRYGY